MDARQPSTPTQGVTDVFTLTDQVLSDRLQFVEEIGFGNWGSVWLCRPKSKHSESSKKSLLQDQIAVKLVHRSDKSASNAARVKSLWNEMKIIKSFKADPHPSIIPFHSFIITPSYALITMTYIPTLVPVEVDELKAREWFRFLLSGIEFLHRRGVVHNDIKPANILVSDNNIPVLVDFGFAEKYESGEPTAFQSNLSYGTPEYLAPERARGLPHDTRKSDIWSLGVTFFEILMGRTPFENSDTDQCTTKEELERYWQRTLSGNWLGDWKMTPGMERLLRRMIAPNAELRCTAVQAMNDPYWQYRKEMRGTHKTSSSYGSSIVFEKDLAKLMLLDQPPMPSRASAIAVVTNNTPSIPSTPPGLSPAKRLSLDKKKDTPSPTSIRVKPKLPAKIAPPTTPKLQPRKRVATGATTPLRPKTPTSSSVAAAAKENIKAFNLLSNSNSTNTAAATVSTPTRRPQSQGGRENLVPRVAARPATALGDNKEKEREKRRSRVLGDVPVNVNRPGARDYRSKDSLRREGGRASPLLVKKEVKKEPSVTSDKTRSSGSDSVRNRVKEWERERQRLREIARLEEIEREIEEATTEEEEEDEKEEEVEVPEKVAAVSQMEEEEVVEIPRRVSGISTPALSRSTATAVTSESPKTPPLSTSKDSISRAIKPNLRPLEDDTDDVDVYKSSPAQMTGRSTPAVWLAASPKADSPKNRRQSRDSWANDILGEKTSSPLSSILGAKQSERIVADAKRDRMEAWMRTVEPVLEDSKSSFTSSSVHDILPSLPIPPSRSASRYPSSRSSRNPRRVLSASQIFNSDGGPAGTETPDTSVAGIDTSLVSTPSKGSILPSVPEVSSPARARRATVSTSSPSKVSGGPHEEDSQAGSPTSTRRREKSKSYGNLLQLRIAPIAELEAEINKPVIPNSSRRLSEVVDSSLFIAPPRSPPPANFDDDDQDLSAEYPSFNDLTSSPIVVESLSKRSSKPTKANLPETPSQRRLEGVYDRFRLATSGVRRLTKGYQNDMSTPAMSPTPQAVSVSSRKTPSSRRQAAPPPVALKNFKFDASTHRRTVSAAELGMMSCPAAGAVGQTLTKDDSKNTVGLMKRALKAMVPGKTASRRLSRAA